MADECLVVAISRKGPRLIELLVEEGIADRELLRRVISERALPFVESRPSKLVVADDNVAWGSTYCRVFDETKSFAKLKWGDDSIVTGAPFAVSDGAHPVAKSVAARSFQRFTPDNVTQFVNSQASSIRLLGKPLDLEFPIASFSGDFNDGILVDLVIKLLAESLRGQVVKIDSEVDCFPQRAVLETWTILLPLSRSESEFSKLRIFLNAAKRHLTVAALSPQPILDADFCGLGKTLPTKLRQAWEVMNQSGRIALANPATTIPTKRSLIAWFNYLASLPTLVTAVQNAQKVMTDHNLTFTYRGISDFDLQLLVGRDYLTQLRETIDNLAEVSFSANENHSDTQIAPIAPIESFPSQYCGAYQNIRSEMLSVCSSVPEAVEAVFHAQHLAIEVPSRKQNDACSSEDRLDFGMTFGSVANAVRRFTQMDSSLRIHEAFDLLIDRGQIVPRYMQIKNGEQTVWRRVFRVGEGPGAIKRLLDAVLLLFRKLTKELKQESVAPVVFEKLCVLALTELSQTSSLSEFQELKVGRRFKEYGARSTISLGGESRFLVDWAIEQRVFRRAEGQIWLGKSEPNYPAEECSWSNELKDRIEDLAVLFSLIDEERNLKTDALTLLSSTFTRMDFMRALAGELNSWLYDPRHSIYQAIFCIEDLFSSSRSGKALDSELKRCDTALAASANYTAQARVKCDLHANRDQLISQVGVTTKADRVAERVWRDLREQLLTRDSAEGPASGITQISSTIAIAEQATSLLRDLVSQRVLETSTERLFEVENDARTTPLRESLKRLMTAVCEADVVTRELFSALKNDGRGIETEITTLIESPCDTFQGSAKEILALVRTIADRCSLILARYGGDIVHEKTVAIEPPQFILMWDVRDSNKQNKDELNQLMANANQRIADLGDRIYDFRSESRDDGNGLICTKFSTVLAAVQILVDLLQTKPFRAGVESLMQGNLNYYPESHAIGGRAYEHAARVMSFFKETKSDPASWSGSTLIEEPKLSYLVVGEFAKRFAIEQKAWESSEFDAIDLEGRYCPRIRNAIPIDVSLLTMKQPPV